MNNTKPVNNFYFSQFAAKKSLLNDSPIKIQFSKVNFNRQHNGTNYTITGTQTTWGKNNWKMWDHNAWQVTNQSTKKSIVIEGKASNYNPSSELGERDAARLGEFLSVVVTSLSLIASIFSFSTPCVDAIHALPLFSQDKQSSSNTVWGIILGVRLLTLVGALAYTHFSQKHRDAEDKIEAKLVAMTALVN